MKMNEGFEKRRRIVRLIGAIGGWAVLLCVIAGCLSVDMSQVMAKYQQNKTVTAYEMVVMPAANTLAGKKAVVFDLEMADKVLPKTATGTSGGGGLFGAALGAAGNAADLKNFNDAVTSESWLTQEREALARKQAALSEGFNARYTELNGAGTERAAFDFGGASPTLDYFSKGDAGIAAKIAAACEAAGADYAVTMVGQIVYQETMQAAPIAAAAELRVEVCLFDKTGAPAAQGKIVTLSGQVKPASGITTFRLFLDDAIEDIILMLPALGGNGDRTGTKAYAPPTAKADTGDTREAGPDETVLVVKRIDGSSGWPTTLVLDKGTDSERMIPLAVKKEVRVVIPNGAHVLAAEIEGGTKEKNDPLSITADGTPITYTLRVKGTIGPGNLKDNERFTWTKQ
ncbi:MAG: hypothetical protein LBF83_01580 [Spirochaetaceae bacterium]|jgi:hypothetical protein|nr:hypothetical protein [Spirochaetaceae bacterium]